MRLKRSIDEMKVTVAALMLVMTASIAYLAGPRPEVRETLDSHAAAMRRRAIRIVAWQRDKCALQTLQMMQQLGKQVELVTWAIDKSELLPPMLGRLPLRK